jgi:hypothetical protein
MWCVLEFRRLTRLNVTSNFKITWLLALASRVFRECHTEFCKKGSMSFVGLSDVQAGAQLLFVDSRFHSDY